MPNDLSLIALLALATLLPFLFAAGTCFLKFSIVLVMVRNALGLPQVPSNMVLNAVALMMSLFVMLPVVKNIHDYHRENPVNFTDQASVESFFNHGLDSYREYLQKYIDPELAIFFSKIQTAREGDGNTLHLETDTHLSIFALLPAYALSEIKSAFKIAFYLYLPFVVIDLVISSILLALGMMMMSPVVISIPVKLVLFVALDGWSILSQGLILQYIDLSRAG